MRRIPAALVVKAMSEMVAVRRLASDKALHLDHRYLLQAKQNCRRIVPMAGNDQAAFVDQDRDQKAEGGNAVRHKAIISRMLEPKRARQVFFKWMGEPTPLFSMGCD
jgi:hypothetical protein